MSDRDYDDEELADVAEELAGELRELRTELERREQRRGPPRGPLGLPRPPTPGEVIRFADEFAIPAVIAILEANIKLLEALRGALRVARGGRRASERGRRTGERAAEAAGEVGRATMSRLEDSLADLRTAIESGGLPDDPEARDLLSDVQELQEEIDERLRSARDGDGRRRTGDRSGPGEAGDGDAAETDEDGVEVDVDAELDSLRERYSEDDGDDGEEPGSDDTEE